MTPPDLAVRAGSAIPELTARMVAAATAATSVPLQLSASLLVGLALTAVAWLALLLVVAHGRYVTKAVADGEYGKGPFSDRNRGAKTGSDDADERARRRDGEDE